MKTCPRTPRLSALLLLGLGLLLLGPTSFSQEALPKLIVGTKQAAPFSFRIGDGPWQGISIDLWVTIAHEMGVEYELREEPLEELINGLVEGRLDASVAALTVTAEREQVVDFTHPFHPSGLGIAVSTAGGGNLFSLLRAILSVGFLQAAGTLLVVLFVGGAVLWFFERKRNEAQFGGSAVQGLGSAFWWSAVTMTTVGYGDKAPVTGVGRIVAVIWMFTGVITISSLTAAIASTLTVSKLESSISGPHDLPNLGKIACVRGSTGESYLRTQRLPTLPFDSADAAMESVANRTARAVVYDAPILKYLAITQFEGRVTVLPSTFERQDYAIALPLDSPLRKRVNKALLERTSSEAWNDVLHTYLGSSLQR